MNRIALISLFDENYKEIADLTSLNKFEYCAAHDYSFHLVKHPVAEPPAHFSKIPLIETLLRLHDWVVWIDTDAVIMNFRRRIEHYLDDRFSLIVGTDWNGMNTGVFFLRRTDWSFKFLERTTTVSRSGLKFFEQDQIIRTVESDPRKEEHVKTIKLKQCGGEGDFNCYPIEDRNYPRHELFQYYDHGDFIVHCPGSRLFGEEHKRFLDGLLKKYLKEVIR